MDPHRKLWNANHQMLNRLLRSGDRESAIPLFLDQHAMVHSAKGLKSKLWSFEDELLDDMSEPEMRQIPPGGEHSIAWILFHISRIEDITMNMLVAGTAQLFRGDDWVGRMNVSVLHSANRMSEKSVAELSATVDLKCLRKYRTAIAHRTRQIVQELEAEDFKRKIDPSRVERVLEEGAVTREAIAIASYWSKKTIAGLLLMPSTRHCLLHLNEGVRIRGMIRRGESKRQRVGAPGDRY